MDTIAPPPDERELKRHAKTAKRTEQKLRGALGPHGVRNGFYYEGFRKAPIAGATAEFENGADKKRMTGTRVITGAVLFGPAGAVVGGLLKKNKSKCYVTTTFADGNVAIVEVPVKQERQARDFAAKVNAAGAYYQQ